ncbi:uncharacterized protein LOC128954526 [Oppia nitens]|uniref:uncharacterized protein LOC128954526 n=1 Tax=Oppia nitens TaxID=1686743 RepID=UPI0023DCBF4A|nr:uncharacterized protein LOC128954526 [Oppia nitens]
MSLSELSATVVLLLSIVCMIWSVSSSAAAASEMMGSHGYGNQISTLAPKLTPECKQIAVKIKNCFRKRWHIKDSTKRDDPNKCCYYIEYDCASKPWYNKCLRESDKVYFETVMKNCTEKGFTPNADNCLPLKPLSTVADGVCDEYLHCFLVTTDPAIAVVSTGVGQQLPSLLMSVIVVTIVWSVALVV